MATSADIIKRVRRELGDFGEPFRATITGDGQVDRFELPVGQIATSSLRISALSNGGLVDLVPDTDFTVDADSGVVFLVQPLALARTLIAEGKAYAIFSDDDLAGFVHDAVIQHTAGQHVNTRYRDDHGFLHVRQTPVTLDNLPEVEELLVAILATIEALWALTTDASTDIDIDTADGTHVARSQRYAQMRLQIEVLTEKYTDLCQQLNVGLHRIEVSNLRRVSRTTGRLVSEYIEREYDDYSMPIRILPPIDQRNADYDGPASPAYPW